MQSGQMLLAVINGAAFGVVSAVLRFHSSAEEGNLRLASTTACWLRLNHPQLTQTKQRPGGRERDREGRDGNGHQLPRRRLEIL